MAVLTKKELLEIGCLPGSIAWQEAEIEELLAMPIKRRKRRVVPQPKPLPKNPQGQNKPPNSRGR